MSIFFIQNIRSVLDGASVVLLVWRNSQGRFSALLFIYSYSLLVECKKYFSLSMVNYCTVYGCNSKSTKTDIRFHRFPRDPALARTWSSVLRMQGRSITRWSVVCSRHFSPTDYRTFSGYIEGIYKRPPLKKFAVPSQNLPELSHETMDQTVAEEAKDILEEPPLDKGVPSENLPDLSHQSMDQAPAEEAKCNVEEINKQLPLSEGIESSQTQQSMDQAPADVTKGMEPCFIGIALGEACHKQTRRRKIAGFTDLMKLTPKAKEILENRTGLTLKDESTLCLHHKTKLLSSVYESSQKRCCDLFKIHSRPITKCLQPISYELMKEGNSKLQEKIICGQKMCSGCMFKLKTKIHGTRKLKQHRAVPEFFKLLSNSELSHGQFNFESHGTDSITESSSTASKSLRPRFPWRHLIPVWAKASERKSRKQIPHHGGEDTAQHSQWEDAYRLIFQEDKKLVGSKQKRITQPSKRKKPQKKNENPNQRKRGRKILRPLEEQEKLEQELLASTTQIFPGSTSSSKNVIFPQSTTANEIVGSTSKANHGAVLRIEALPVLNIKTEPEEEGEILGPQLSNFLDSSVEEEDIPRVKIKEEPPDDLPDIESFGLLEPIVEMTFQCEEPAENNGTDYLDGCDMKVKEENCHD